jgi:hypothetical protein
MNTTATATATMVSKIQSNMDLFTISKNTGTCDLECSVCFKGIQKTFFRCGAPCNKIFHVDCMEQMIERTAESAWEEEKEPEHKCCYCRRQINIASYILQRFVRHLATLKASGCYDVAFALEQIKEHMANGDIDADFEYQIYEIHRHFRQKTPKQTKRAATYMKNKPAIKQSRMRINQNIGGRRR